MTLLVTGATGFVMSVLAHHWLSRDPSARVVALDREPLDDLARAYFAPVADRMILVQADVTDPVAIERALQNIEISHVVHGATVTPLSRGTASEAAIEPEARNPAAIMDTNLMGTVHVLDWARGRRISGRFVYVSSGAVYRHHGPDTPGMPLPEDGYVWPRRLYGISKLAAELVTERYAGLFGLSAVSVRLSSVYGTMDRTTATRNFRHIPNRISHLGLAGRKIRVNTLAAVGDYCHSEDVAAGIAALLDAPALNYPVYNIAQGETATVGDLLGWAADAIPGLVSEVTDDPAEADILADPALVGGMWGAYDIGRMIADTGWRPRPTRTALHAYIDRLRNEAG